MLSGTGKIILKWSQEFRSQYLLKFLFHVGKFQLVLPKIVSYKTINVQLSEGLLSYCLSLLGKMTLWVPMTGMLCFVNVIHRCSDRILVYFGVCVGFVVECCFSRHSHRMTVPCVNICQTFKRMINPLYYYHFLAHSLLKYLYFPCYV